MMLEHTIISEPGKPSQNNASGSGFMNSEQLIRTVKSQKSEGIRLIMVLQKQHWELTLMQQFIQ
jgi:hypothetical protein